MMPLQIMYALIFHSHHSMYMYMSFIHQVRTQIETTTSYTHLDVSDDAEI
jgi:hypothetical protein